MLVPPTRLHGVNLGVHMKLHRRLNLEHHKSISYYQEMENAKFARR